VKAVLNRSRFSQVAALLFASVLTTGAVEGFKINASLKSKLALQSEQINELSAHNSRLENDGAAFPSALALSENGPLVRHNALGSPSSTLDWASAVRAAPATKI
jgi:hypothetical protein